MTEKDAQTILVNVRQLIADQDAFASQDVSADDVPTGDTISCLIARNHYHNHMLWNEEDKARRDDMGFEYVYHAKRTIDHHNQQRNNMMEKIDIILHNDYNLKELTDVPNHSETPGMIIDRLAILSLKVFHMGIEANRASANEEHRQQCQHKLDVLCLQRKHLAGALERLLQNLADKIETFTLYKQMKMYNDPNLNPQLYQKDS